MYQRFAIGNCEVEFRIRNVIDFRLQGSAQFKYIAQGHQRFREGLAIFECGGEAGIAVRPDWHIRIGAAGGTDDLGFIVRIESESAFWAQHFGPTPPSEPASV